MRKGLVEFVDASHWLIRPQNPEHVWSIQYACFSYADCGRGEYNQEIPYDRCRVEEQITEIDSRAPGLQEGDERYVEVQIQRHVAKKRSRSPSSEDGSNRRWESALDYAEEDL